MNKKKHIIVSVVITAYNAERFIDKAIESILSQSYNDYELILVENGSNDNTYSVIKRYCKNPKVRLLKLKSNLGPGGGRNAGADIAKGEILIFVDSDMTFDKDYIKNLVRPIFNGITYGTCHGVEYAANMNNKWARCWGRIRVSPTEKEGIIFRAIRKDIFLEKGGFDPKYGYADDQTFFIKYGMKSLAVPDSICYHRNAESLKEVYKHSRWIGASLLCHYKILKSPLLAIPFLIFFAIMIIPLAILLSIKKLLFVRDFSLTFYYPIFYFVRIVGSFVGFYNWLIKGINIR